LEANEHHAQSDNVFQDAFSVNDSNSQFC